MDYYKLKVLNNKRIIIYIIVSILIIIGIAIYYFKFYKVNEIDVVEEVNIQNNEDKIENVDSSNIYVDIKGYVEKPGVYSFNKSDNARVNDLILKAGGLRKDADTTLINLSKKLEDEMTIIIYSQREVNNYLNEKNTLKEKLELCELKLKNNACIKENISNSNKKELVNINTASKEELMTLQGIGEAKASAIINYRTKTPFKKIEDLLNVDGIGDSLFESIKKSIEV